MGETKGEVEVCDICRSIAKTFIGLRDLCSDFELGLTQDIHCNNGHVINVAQEIEDALLESQ